MPDVATSESSWRRRHGDRLVDGKKINVDKQKIMRHDTTRPPLLPQDPEQQPSTIGVANRNTRACFKLACPRVWRRLRQNER